MTVNNAVTSTIESLPDKLIAHMNYWPVDRGKCIFIVRVRCTTMPDWIRTNGPHVVLSERPLVVVVVTTNRHRSWRRRSSVGRAIHGATMTFILYDDLVATMPESSPTFFFSCATTKCTPDDAMTFILCSVRTQQLRREG
jgi:hypothetical protein